MKRIAVIGAGFSGLAAAHRLFELAPDSQVTLFEASQRVGGVAQTERWDGFLIEHGADMFTTREPWAMDLCRRIGFDAELIGTNRQHARAFVVRDGQLHPVPEGFTLMTPGRFWPIAKSPLLSVAGKLRMAGEYFVKPRRDATDESLASFVTRRFGREAFERLIQPLISGIYTADAEKLSMQAALPQFVEMEQKHGGLIRAVRKKHGTASPTTAVESSSGARYGLFVAPRRGMDSFLEAIAGRLPSGTIKTSTPICAVMCGGDGVWDVLRSDGSAAERFDAVVVATPAPVAAKLLSSKSTELADHLDTISYASAVVVILAYRREQLPRAPVGFGIVVPLVERRRIIAASFASTKFEGRAPSDTTLIRVFVGGACQPELVDLNDNALVQLARDELGQLIGATGEPILIRVVRWNASMPQYHVGHLDRIARIEQLVGERPGLALAGNAYRGVGIPQCIRSGELAAARVLGIGLAESGEPE